jgi:hypothetical protein
VAEIRSFPFSHANHDGQTRVPQPEQAPPGKKVVRYRVDTVPWPLRPLYFAAAWAAGVVLYLYYFFCRMTSQISIEGPGNHDLSRHSIFCIWHESWWSYFVAFMRFRSPHAMISHPAAYMKPLHCVFGLMGLKRLLLGSSGDEGRRAVNELACLVRSGWSTTISRWSPWPAAVSEERRAPYRCAKWSADRPIDYICDSLHFRSQLGRQKASFAIQPDQGGSPRTYLR